MSASNALETALLALMFNNTACANFGDAGGLQPSSAPGSTQLALSTGTLADTDTLLTASETAYTTYARPTQARSAAGWTVSGNQVSNAALITFGLDTVGAGVVAHSLGLGFIATGNVLALWAILTADLTINPGVTPQFAIGSLIWNVD